MKTTNKDSLFIRWLGLELKADGREAIVAVVLLAIIYFAARWIGI
jgi:hypothetical protein